MTQPIWSPQLLPIAPQVPPPTVSSSPGSNAMHCLSKCQFIFTCVLSVVFILGNATCHAQQQSNPQAKYSLGAESEGADLHSFRTDAREVNPPVVGTETIALVGGRLIDGRGGAPILDSCVLVRDGEIVSAGMRDEVAIPKEAEIIKLDGKTLLPGFVDCHFHSINDLNPPRTFLYNGVTSFRDPGHPFRFYQAVKQAKEPMPRVFLCGGHLDAYPPIWPNQAVIIDSDERAREAVTSHVQNGATAIKIYFRLPLTRFKTICEAADEHSIPVTAHLELVKATEAIRAGVDGIEHVTSFGTSLAEPDDVQNFVTTISANPGRRTQLRFRLWSRLNLDENQHVEALIKQITDTETVLSPTLAVFERRSNFDNVEDFEVTGFANMLAFVRKCHQADATIVVGSHTWVRGADFGWAFHREMELLVECGMSPLEVLSAATWKGAQFMGAQSRIGSLEAGKQADLVIVDGDPTVDIKAARNIERVMLAGKWVSRDR